MTRCGITSAHTCNTPAMRLIWLARGLGVSGLSAVAAVAAHEGPAALTSGRALIVALAGASLAAMGVALLLAAAVSRYARAARVRRGDLLAARLDSATAPGASALVAAMLVCQGAAHISLTAVRCRRARRPAGVAGPARGARARRGGRDDRLRAAPARGRRHPCRRDRMCDRHTPRRCGGARVPARADTASGSHSTAPTAAAHPRSQPVSVSEPPARAGRSLAPDAAWVAFTRPRLEM